MTTARQIIDDSLSFGLNRLGPGESASTAEDTFALRALNSIVDEFNGAKSMLHRTILSSSSSISTVSAVLGTAWSGLAPGDKILGATYVSNDEDMPMWELTMEQYHAIPDKAETGEPQFWAHDGLATVYFSPVPTGHVIKLRTKQVFTDFADTTTDYSMPKGYRSAFAALLTEKLAGNMGGLTPAIARAATAARMRLLAQTVNPAIVNATNGGGKSDIIRGW